MSDTTRLINPTPKHRFQQSNDNISKHRQLVDSREFERACDFALMEYQGMLLSNVSDGNGAAAAGLKLKGVQEFLTVFRQLSETVRIPSVKPLTDHLSETDQEKGN